MLNPMDVSWRCKVRCVLEVQTFLSLCFSTVSKNSWIFSHSFSHFNHFWFSFSLFSLYIEMKTMLVRRQSQHWCTQAAKKHRAEEQSNPPSTIIVKGKTTLWTGSQNDRDWLEKQANYVWKCTQGQITRMRGLFYWSTRNCGSACPKWDLFSKRCSSIRWGLQNGGDLKADRGEWTGLLPLGWEKIVFSANKWALSWKIVKTMI